MRTLLMLTAVFLSGCAMEPPAPTVVVPTDSFCRIYKPIRWSPADTPETVTQVLRENAKFKACAKGSNQS